MDGTGLNALDVLIGLVFMFFLLSIVASTINELIAQLFNLRARTLERGVRNLLGAKTGAFWDHPLIRPLMDERRVLKVLPGVAAKRKPSYIDARTFALAALDTLGADRAPGDTTDRDVIAGAQATAAQIQNEALRTQVLATLTAARTDLDHLRANVEASFDHVMDRATGWYKRRVQTILFVIGLALTVGINADAFHVADRLWKEDALRASVVAQATATAEKAPATAGTTPDDVARQIDEVKALELPLGWPDGFLEDFGPQIPGWLVTAFALTMGAPFWFDVLGKLSKVRAVGNREGTPKDDERVPEDRDDPSRRRPARG